MKKRWLVIIMAALLSFSWSSTALADDPEGTVSVIEETKDEDGNPVTVIEVKAEYEGDVTDAPDTYEYNGQVYDLIYVKTEQKTEKQYTGTTDYITEVIALPEGETTQIPREKVYGGLIYHLDESSLAVTVTKTEHRYGERVVDVYRTYTMPDNDMSKLPQTVSEGNRTYDLMEAEYKVSKTDEYGLPTEYEATCKYSTLVGYSIEYAIAWETPARYYRQETRDVVVSSVITAHYKYTELPLETVPETEEPTDPVTETEPETEHVTDPITVTPTDPPKENAVPWEVVTGGGAAGIVLLAFVGFLGGRRVAVESKTAAGEWKKIGKARKRKNILAVPGSVIRRAETNLYRAKMSSGSEGKEFVIKTPDGEKKAVVSANGYLLWS